MKRWTAGIAGALLVTILAVAVFMLRRPIVKPLVDDHPECPVDSATGIRILDSTGGRAPGFKVLHTLALASGSAFVPEYNDCQRFPVGATKSYGPLVAIFAADSLNQVEKAIYDSAAERPKAAVKRALPIALILDWGATTYAKVNDYDPLHIVRGATGFNCLYMWAEITPHPAPGHPHAADTTRHGVIAQAASANGACAPAVDPQSPPAGARTLQVTYRPTNPPHGLSQHAAVARWDWDERNHEQYIVIGCREGWCDISDDRTTLDPSQSRDDPKESPDERRPRRLKEFYDEEYLAEAGPPGGPPLVQGTVRGTFFPAADLKAKNFDPNGGAYKNHWVRVAGALISEPSPTYLKKLNFTEPLPSGKTFGDSLNKIDLCMGTFADCAGPSVPLPKTCPNSTATATTRKYWARITSTNGVVSYRCVAQRIHTNMDIPGIVRWRWTTTDQQGWIACPSGCCEVIENQ